MGYDLDRALFVAAAKWDIDAVMDFVEAWADVNFYDHDGTVLEQACLSKNFDIVKYLVEKNVDITDQWVWLSLIAAALWDDLTIFNYLIEKGAIIDPNYWSTNPENILIAAACGGHWDLVKTCVEKGVDIQGKIYSSFMGKRYNSLYFAIRENNLEMIKFLLENWIDQEGALDNIIILIFMGTGDTEAIKYYLEKWYSFNKNSIKLFKDTIVFDKNNKEHIEILTKMKNRLWLHF